MDPKSGQKGKWLKQQMRNDEKTVRNKITLISFLCSIAVIWIHTHNLYSYGITAADTGLKAFVRELENYWTLVVGGAVPVFFLISGFLFFRTFEWSKLLDKYKSRFLSIVLPYLIWCTIYYLFFVFITNVPAISAHVSYGTYVFSFKNWIMALGPDCYYTLWFLRNLIIFIAITPILYLLAKNWLSLPTGLLVTIFLLVNSVIHLIDLPMGLDMYALGSYIAINHKGIEYYRNHNISYAGAVIMLIMLITNIVYRNDFTITVFFLAGWFLIDLIQINNPLPWWTTITFFYYVAHGMVLAVLEKALLMIGGQNVWFALFDYLFMPLITVFVLAVIASRLRKHDLLWNLLNGFR